MAGLVLVGVRRVNFTVGKQKELKQRKFEILNIIFSHLVAYITKCELNQKCLTLRTAPNINHKQYAHCLLRHTLNKLKRSNIRGSYTSVSPSNFSSNFSFLLTLQCSLLQPLKYSVDGPVNSLPCMTGLFLLRFQR